MKKGILLLTALLGFEGTLFFYYYFFGEHGHKKIAELRQQQEHLTITVQQLQKEIEQLEKRLREFKEYPYYKEKIIREQLQMMKPDEVIYKLP